MSRHDPILVVTPPARAQADRRVRESIASRDLGLEFARLLGARRAQSMQGASAERTTLIAMHADGARQPAVDVRSMQAAVEPSHDGGPSGVADDAQGDPSGGGTAGDQRQIDDQCADRSRLSEYPGDALEDDQATQGDVSIAGEWAAIPVAEPRPAAGSGPGNRPAGNREPDPVGGSGEHTPAPLPMVDSGDATERWSRENVATASAPGLFALQENGTDGNGELPLAECPLTPASSDALNGDSVVTAGLDAADRALSARWRRAVDRHEERHEGQAWRAEIAVEGQTYELVIARRSDGRLSVWIDADTPDGDDLRQELAARLIRIDARVVLENGPSCAAGVVS